MKPFSQPQEWKLVSLRECPLPSDMQICDTPDRAADYWKTHVAKHPYFNAECECFVVLLLNTRRKIKGHHLVSIGTLDTILVHPREVFRLAIVAAASAIVIMHNHPSGVMPYPVLCRMARDSPRFSEVTTGSMRHKTEAASQTFEKAEKFVIGPVSTRPVMYGSDFVEHGFL